MKSIRFCLKIAQTILFLSNQLQRIESSNFLNENFSKMAFIDNRKPQINLDSSSGFPSKALYVRLYSR